MRIFRTRFILLLIYYQIQMNLAYDNIGTSDARQEFIDKHYVGEYSHSIFLCVIFGRFYSILILSSLKIKISDDIKYK